MCFRYPLKASDQADHRLWRGPRPNLRNQLVGNLPGTLSKPMIGAIASVGGYLPPRKKKTGKTHPRRDQLEFPVLIRKHYLRIGPATFPGNGVQNAHLGIIWNFRTTLSRNHLRNYSFEFPKRTCTKHLNWDQLEFPSYIRKTKNNQTAFISPSLCTKRPTSGSDGVFE